VRALLISTYDLGRQPFGLASAAAVLRAAGVDVTCLDLAKQRLDPEPLGRADAVAFFLPMHTATRLALPVIDRVRSLNPSARLIAYGLYAPLNEALLRERGVRHVIGGEFEDDLVRAVTGGTSSDEGAASRLLPRVNFLVPDRQGLPGLSRYATVQIGSERRVAGYTEASRGCKHRCRHCPIVPVYDGRFRAVAADVVLADIRAQVAAGAQHITFGDPDFFNGPTHALAIVDALAREFPGVTYDATIKVEHLKQQAARLPRLVATGCAFVTTAVESFDDQVLEKLEKGHTHAEFVDVVRHCASIGLALSPTFVAFTPWTTIDGYLGMLREIDRLGLVGAVSPIQYAIRLLIPQASRMLEVEAVRARIERFDPRSLTCIWTHADPRVDALQQRLEALVGSRLNAPRDEIFARVWEIAHEAAGAAAAPRQPLLSRAAVPYLNEPWYC
jgi:radical SAM superfamily enzyme YgiQ (UPF0313 family)